MSNISEVLKKIMDSEKFPDYPNSQKTTRAKKAAGEKNRGNELIAVWNTKAAESAV